MLAPEDDLELLYDDWRTACRRLASLERAPFESRVANVDEYQRSVHFARQRELDLRNEYRAALAELENEEDVA